MAEITASLVKALRDATNVSMMECKRALVEAEGDMEKATRLLREMGVATAVKKSSRAANQGLVASVASADGNTCSLIEVNCETDFVARNDTFQAFVGELARKACDTDDNLADMLKDEVTAKVAEIGENIVVRRNARFVLEGKGTVASYIHPGSKVGVLVEVNCEKDETAGNDIFKELVKDITLHVAALDPGYLDSTGVPEDVVAGEREIFAKQIQNKPPEIVDKIVAGKLKKYFAEVCLLDQGFVKEPKQSITALLAAKGKELEDTLVIRRYLRYQLGE